MGLKLKITLFQKEALKVEDDGHARVSKQLPLREREQASVVQEIAS